MFDGVGTGFACGDEYVPHRLRWQVALVEPAAQGFADPGGLGGLGAEGDVQRGGVAIQQQGHVIFVTVGRAQAGP